MRDHLLGCQAFLPPEPNPRDRDADHLRRCFPLGIPERAIRDSVARIEGGYLAKKAVADFEDRDHTPAGMMADFPREYDLQTMLEEAAGRFKFFGVDLAKGPDFSAFLADYDAELQRLCGL